jgi:dimethylargininase
VKPSTKRELRTLKDTFNHAIVRTPGANFADGLTTVSIGTPDFAKVLDQHQRYCHALEGCGLTLTTLPADLHHPDSTFVEDTAVLTEDLAVLTRPGAHPRAGEVESIRSTIAAFYPKPHQIKAPGTLDGGDICEAGSHFFIGVSHRTNPEGARQLAALLAPHGYTSSIIDVRGMTTILHLKSGIACIGDNTLVVMEEMAANEQFCNYQRIVVPARDTYAANCVRVNDRVLIAAGFPQLAADLTQRGFHPLVLDMSEFQKMDGGLSCLSLRFLYS